jgi:hypothetical protein
MSSRPQKPALGALAAGIVGGTVSEAELSQAGSQPITETMQEQRITVLQPKQRGAKPGGRKLKDDGKMQTVYLHGQDLDRATEVEYLVKRTRVVKGRVGLSLVVRAGLKLLAEEITKNERRGVEIVASVAGEG